MLIDRLYTNLDIVNKMVGNIYPSGESNGDADKFENLKEMCDLTEKLISQLQHARITDEHHLNCPWQEDEIQEPEETQEELWKSLLDQYQNDNLTGTDLENVKFMAVISVCIFLKERVTLIRK